MTLVRTFRGYVWFYRGGEGTTGRSVHGQMRKANLSGLVHISPDTLDACKDGQAAATLPKFRPSLH